MKQRRRIVISDNTNTQASTRFGYTNSEFRLLNVFLQQSWEMLPYFKLAADNGYTTLVLEPGTAWSHDCSRLAAMTLHGVPKDKIELMKSR